MLFFIFRIFRLVRSQAKKNKANGTSEQQQQQTYPAGSYYPQGTQTGTSNMNPEKFGSAKALVEDFIRFVQFIFGLVVIGLYGQDLNGDHSKAKWVYAVITGGLASLTTFIYLIAAFVAKDRPLRARPHLHMPLFLWETILCILWLTLFGIFAKIYIGKSNTNDDTSIKKMKNAVWVDLTNLGLWIITGLWAGLRWNKSRQGVPQGDAESNADPEKAEVAP